ncbi:MAG TPA: hypothetical protein VFF03_10155 [Rhodocyclaceae bacterium]|nr:hypothetical protein [Rhodocyclaceae bacterium]
MTLSHSRLPQGAKEKIFSADEARDFAAEIRRMRRQELHFWLAFAAFTLLCTFALETTAQAARHLSMVLAAAVDR